MSVRPARPLRAALVIALLVAGLLPAAVDAATVTVRMSGGLSPRSITIAPGTTVRWVNDSDDRHRMRSRNGPVEFDSGNIEPGESFAFTFGTVGTYPYLDDRDRDDGAFHGTVIVTEASTGRGSGGSGDGAPAPAVEAPASATVRMAGRKFSPGTVAIAAGGSVTFVNDDDREHTASGDTFDTGVLDSGARSTQRFPTAGTFAYLCLIHPEMRATVSVRGESGNAPPPAAATPVPATPAPSAAPPAATDAAVAIVDFEFDLALVEVAVGTTVTWTNRGAAPHTVTANGGAFDSGLIVSGGVFPRRFDAAGRFTYVCAFHPDMVGMVVVTSSGSSPSPSPSSPPTASPSATPSATPDGGGGNVAAAPPAAGAHEPPAQPISVQATESFLRLVLVAVVVAGGVVAFGVLVVTSARPKRSHR